MASTKLTYTQVTGSTNGTKIFTISAWVKRGAIGGGEPIWSSGTASTDSIDFHIDSNDCCVFESWDNSVNPKITTTRKLRDPAAWYHIVIAVDSTESVSTDRMKMWINGVQQTVFTASVYPSLNYDFPGTGVASDIIKIAVGTQASYTTKFWSGVMSHVHFVEGTAYTASTFGETDSTSGIWKIKTSPTVTYGNNGFFLKMEDASNLDLDSSPNALTFTTTGTLTATKDNPSNNFCTMNPINNYYAGMTLSNGNTTLVTGSGIYAPLQATLGMAGGKWYWEMKCIASPTNNEYLPGIASTQTTSSGAYLGDTANDYSMRSNNGQYYTNASGTAYGSSYDDGDIISIALDLTNNKLYFAKNNTWQDSGDPTSGATGTGAISITAVGSTAFGAYVPAFTYWDSGTGTVNYNFGNGYFGTTAITSAGTNASGNGTFEYDVPTGYTALCTKGINSF